jgi:tetratricopeptide (TPR) repeat protein
MDDGSSPTPRARRIDPWLAAILVVAALVRGAWFAERAAQPDYAHPAVDADYHDHWARDMVGLPHELPDGVLDPAFSTTPCLRPPGYVWFLAAVFGVSGGSYAAPRVAQHLLGLLTVVLVYLLGRRAFGVLAGRYAAGLTALHWGLLYFEGELHAEALLLPLLLGGLLLALGGAERARSAALAGLVLGLACIVRPNALLVLPCVTLWLAWTRGRRAGARAGLGAAALLLFGGLVGIAPATLRNWRASGELVPITTAGGINLWLGNHAGASGFIDSDLGDLGQFRTCFDYPAVVANLERRLGRELTHGEVSDFFAERAWADIEAHPGAALARTWDKALLFWGPREVGHNKEVAQEHARSRVLRWLPLPFVALWGMALFGLVLVARARDAEGVAREALVLVAGVTFVWFLSVLPFFAGARYRVPSVPLLALLAAAGAARLARGRGRGGPAYAAGALAVLAVALVVLLAPPVPGSPVLKWRLDRGRALFEGGDHAAARAGFEAALAEDPGNVAVLFELAITLHAAGDEGGALQRYEQVLRSDPRHPKALFNLGWLHERRGQPVRAMQCYAEALQADPNLAQAAERLLRGALVLAASPDPARRDGEAAVRAAEAALGALGDAHGFGLSVLAAAYAEAGRFPEALRTATRARELALASGEQGAVRALDAALAEYRAGRPYRMNP